MCGMANARQLVALLQRLQPVQRHSACTLPAATGRSIGQRRRILLVKRLVTFRTNLVGHNVCTLMELESLSNVVEHPSSVMKKSLLAGMSFALISVTPLQAQVLNFEGVGAGTALSVTFSGVADQVALDDVMFGVPRTSIVPEPTSIALTFAGLALVGLAARGRCG